MHGFRNNFDGVVLVGERLESVLAQHTTLSLSFTGEINLSLTNSVRFRAQPTGALLSASAQDLDPELLMLVGRRVARVELTTDDVLALDFDTGRLELIDDDPHYETVVISIGDRTIAI